MREAWRLVSGALLLAGCAAPATDPPAPETTRPVVVDQRLVQETRAQRVEYIRGAYRQQKRLGRIAYRLGDAAGELCRDRRVNRIGAFFSDWDQRAAEWLDAAAAATGINLHAYGIEVVDVVEGAPAARAGLQVGDHVIGIDGERLPRGRGAMTVFRRMIARLRAGEERRLEFRVRREAEFLDVTLVPEKGCEFPAVLTGSEAVNAFTDGEVVHVNRGMARFAENDDELATVIAHEMAHITAGHVDAARRNAIVGTAVGTIADVLLAAVVPAYGLARVSLFGKLGAEVGARVYSQESEAEADYVGLYIMARAGFDFHEAPALWRRFGAVDPGQVEGRPFASHPTAPERFSLLERTAREIEAKIQAREPLIPNLASRRPMIERDADATDPSESQIPADAP